jgi:tRNA(Ile2) C34 agmatinyltransferase TiaS
MDSPKCKICGKSTEWYGWLKGWLCPECDAPQLEVMEAEDEEVKLQQYEERKYC